MVDFVEDERIPIEEIFKKIHPEELVHSEGRKMIALKDDYRISEPKPVSQPSLPISKKRLRI